jgi:D-arabinose 1-dehydrogenase-like Zn-dependent alcohol dehydrogenase
MRRGTMMKCQACVEFGGSLETIELPLPVPKGREVLVRVTHAGMCHSDCHLHDGYFNLGGGNKMKLTALKPPFTLGHEIEGEVQAKGADVPDDILVGGAYAVYPWLGCNLQECPYCSVGSTNLCVSPKSTKFTDGNSMYGGYGSHVLVPDFRWLLDFRGALQPGLAGIYMCSGLTAFSALKKVQPPPLAASELLIVGLGGLGLQAVHFAHAMFGGWPMVADMDAGACKVAADLGCLVVDSGDAKACTKAIRAATPGGQGVAGALDFVGAQPTVNLCYGALRGGGTLVTVGLFGALLPTAPLTMHILRQKNIQGTITGTLDECKEMLELLKTHTLEPPPHEFRSIKDANSALMDLKAGKISGRCILRHDWDGVAKI